MKFGIRKPSFQKRASARTSVKRAIRHRAGIKAPRGMGWITNPRKAAYSRVYRCTTRGIGCPRCSELVLLALTCLLVGLLSVAVQASEDTAEPDTDDPVVQGALSKEVIDERIKANLPEIRACYQREADRRPDLEGAVVVTFEISPDGSVAWAEIERTDLDSEEVCNCVLSAMVQLQFPEPAGGGIVRVTYPFHLRSEVEGRLTIPTVDDPYGPAPEPAPAVDEDVPASVGPDTEEANRRPELATRTHVSFLASYSTTFLIAPYDAGPIPFGSVSIGGIRRFESYVGRDGILRRPIAQIRWNFLHYYYATRPGMTFEAGGGSAFYPAESLLLVHVGGAGGYVQYMPVVGVYFSFSALRALGGGAYLGVEARVSGWTFIGGPPFPIAVAPSIGLVFVSE